ncbi:MAG TPA: MauE/DoxX family redox-associated membrane protein, partial [Methylomirabilota bacterium]|nr:MauE/DoxX family redox-associated membrane protein [Methylomirabilota bacterium]
TAARRLATDIMQIRRDPFDLTQPSRPPLWWIGTLGAVVLGAVFLIATWAKALDPEAFAGQIRAEGLEIGLPAATLAWIVLALEAGLGTALLLNVRRLWVLVPTALLVVFFLFLTGRNFYRAENGLLTETTSCGCFGNLVDRTPAEAFWWDLGLLGAPLLLCFVGMPRRVRQVPLARTALAVAAAAGAVAFAVRAPELPLDDLATRLKPGVEIKNLCAGKGSTALCLDNLAERIARGQHLVVMADLDDPSFTRSIDSLNAYADTGRSPELVVLSASAPERHKAFRWKWGPSFEVLEVPEAMLRPLYRRLPRSFEVVDGRVKDTFPGLPPLPAAPPTAAAAPVAAAAPPA